MKIQVGIIGYGNIGRGVELALLQNGDMELAGIFTRRDPATITPLTPGVKVYSIADAEQFQGAIDVMILCGGSATDLPEQGPYFAKMFNTIDSFDTHARIPEYYAASMRRPWSRACVHHFRWLGPGPFLSNPRICRRHPAGGESLHFLGKRRKPRPL